MLVCTSETEKSHHAAVLCEKVIPSRVLDFNGTVLEKRQLTEGINDHSYFVLFSVYDSSGTSYLFDSGQIVQIQVITVI